MPTVPPEERFALKLLFLRELELGLQGAREAQEDYLRDPSNVDAIDRLLRFFHTIAGSADSAGMPLLSAHASLSEHALDLARRGDLQQKRYIARIVNDGLRGVGIVLDEHGADPEPRRNRPSLPPPTMDDTEALALPSQITEGRALSKILVVDDDAFSASLIDNTLRAAGFVSSYTTSSEEALERIERELPDLVVLDVAMPDIDGFEICRRVRRHPALGFTPIIFVTRRGELDERVLGLEVGGNDYIAKPFEPRELVARVRSHLTRLAALRQMAIRDGLTRCFNHRYYKSRLKQELERAKRYEHGMAIAMVDADRFKDINDGYGHLVGDLALAHLANVLLTCVRGTDVVARYGGEEFAVLMIHSAEREAELIAERIRSRVHKEPFHVVDALGERTGATIDLSVSVGVAVLRPEDTEATLIERADDALYAAKEAGRNRVIVR